MFDIVYYTLKNVFLVFFNWSFYLSNEIRFFNAFFIRFASYLASIFLFVRNAVKCYFTDIHLYLSVRACGPHEKEGDEGHPRTSGKGLRPLHSHVRVDVSYFKHITK